MKEKKTQFSDFDWQRDPVRALLTEKIDAAGETMSDVSKALGKAHSYIFGYLKRGYPRALPEDIRAALAARYKIEPDQLRASVAARGSLSPTAAASIEMSSSEDDLLRRWRSLDDEDRVLIDRFIEHVRKLRGNGVK